jgi:F0F1-type ATP synthase assembly protein I
MQTGPSHSGDLSQESVAEPVHRTDVPPLTKSVITRSIDPAARRARSAYRGLSSASVGLELGLSVLIGLLMGMFLDRQLGTAPWLMLLFLVFGFVAGFRGVLRAVRREDREASHG